MNLVSLLSMELRCPRSPLVLSMEIKKLDGGKSKHANLAQRNGFGPVFFPLFVEAGKLNIKNLTPAIDRLR